MNQPLRHRELKLSGLPIYTGKMFDDVCDCKDKAVSARAVHVFDPPHGPRWIQVCGKCGATRGAFRR